MNEINRKVLCVDDERNLLDGLRRQLRHTFDITTAVGGKEGLDVLQTTGPFAVVLADYNMPGMNGIEFLQQVCRMAPETVTAMLTGRAALDIAVAALHEGRIFRFLQKPCPRERLEKTISDCLEQYRLMVSERLLRDDLDRANARLHLLNADLERRVEERTAELRRLYRFVSELNGMDRLEDVAELAVATTAEMLQSRRVSLMLPDPAGEYLSIVAAVGVPAHVRESARVPVGAPLAGYAFAESQCVVINESQQYAGYEHRYDTDFFVVAPLIAASLSTPSHPVGVLNLTEHQESAPYDEEHVATLKALADAAAIAIQNQIRLRERNEARDAVILALAKLAEHRDPETGAHLERVQVYCRLLCETLARLPKYATVIDQDFIDTIVRSSPLHDIGKVGIPDRILLKPGKLTPEEFEVMKTHAAIGGDTIRALLERKRHHSFLQMGMEIAYYHHEKFDGSGYPRRLVGQAIPLPARIVALADVYDALTSRRVYKPPMSHDRAVAIILEGNGLHFDPEVVAAFLERQVEFARVATELRDAVEEAAPPKKTPDPDFSRVRSLDDDHGLRLSSAQQTRDASGCSLLAPGER